VAAAELSLATRTALGAVAWLSLLGAVAWAGWTLVEAAAPSRAQVPPSVEPWTSEQIAERRGATRGMIASRARVIDGRSPFYPARPPEPPKPAVPARYGGPALAGVVANTVYFTDGKKVGLGQAEGGVEVLSISAPWSVRLRWSGGEYDVTLVDRQPIRFDQSPVVKDTLFK
jgi:hypothetical protein